MGDDWGKIVESQISLLSLVRTWSNHTTGCKKQGASSIKCLRLARRSLVNSMKRKAEEMMSKSFEKLVEERRDELQDQRKRTTSEHQNNQFLTMGPLAVLQNAVAESDIKAVQTCKKEKWPLRLILATEPLSVDISNIIDLESSLNMPFTKAEQYIQLPDPKKPGVDPDEYLLEIIKVLFGAKLRVKRGSELKDHFSVITEKQVAAYNMAVVCATRQNKVDELRAIFHDKGKDALDCFNRFGEGLLNMASRRGFKDIVKFLLSDDVQLDVCVHDDYGRTPMHDACWNPEPQLEICKWLMEKDPSLFLVTDNRCFTPLQYARKSDWHTWRHFIFDQRHLLGKLMLPVTLQKFSIVERV